jgi:hypothetical protein
MKRIWWFIRDCIVGIKNVFIWLPIIWHDRHWDYTRIFRLLQKKFSLMEKCFSEKHPLSFIGQDKCYKKIKLCRLLCDRILEDKYEDNAMIPYYKKYNQNIWTFKADTKQQKDEYIRNVKHAADMEKQDIEMLFETLNKNICEWWI